LPPPTRSRRVPPAGCRSPAGAAVRTRARWPRARPPARRSRVRPGVHTECCDEEREQRPPGRAMRVRRLLLEQRNPRSGTTTSGTTLRRAAENAIHVDGAVCRVLSNSMKLSIRRRSSPNSESSSCHGRRKSIQHITVAHRGARERLFASSLRALAPGGRHRCCINALAWQLETAANANGQDRRGPMRAALKDASSTATIRPAAGRARSLQSAASSSPSRSRHRRQRRGIELAEPPSCWKARARGSLCTDLAQATVPRWLAPGCGIEEPTVEHDFRAKSRILAPTPA
jgi:hypothetical protein